MSLRRYSAIGSIEKRIREHLNAKDSKCLQGEYVWAYCKYFSCSTDYLFGFTEVKSPDVDIRKICEKTGLSEQAVIKLCNHTESQDGPSEIHRCWSKLLEGDGFLGIPFDWMAAYDEASEVVKCDAAVAAIETVLQNKDPSSTEYQLLAIKKKPIQKAKEAHYAAYYGMLYKLTQDVTTIMNNLVQRKIDEQKVFEQAVEDLTRQYRNELNGATKTSEHAENGVFRFNKHFIV